MVAGTRRLSAPAIVVVAAIATLVAVAGCTATRLTAPPATRDVPDPAADLTAPADSRSTPELGSSPEVASPNVTTTASPPQALAPTTTLPFGTPSGTLPTITEEEWGLVDAYLQDRLLGGGDFAFGVAVNIDGELVHSAAYGTRNSPDIPLPPPEVETATSVPGETTTTTSTTTTTTTPEQAPETVAATDRFRIASISKVITGTVVLQLVDDGTLSLDSPVGDLLGRHLGVDVTGRPPAEITARQLLSHTSGFNAYRDTFFGRDAESCRDAAARGLTNGVQYDPGTTYEYSNMNFCVLTMLIEAVTGASYVDVVYDRLLEPLGITGMRLAGTFDPNPDEVIHPSFPNRNYMEVLGGAGSWMAAPADIVKIVDSLDNSKPGFHPLPDDLAALMLQPMGGITYSRPDEVWYGLAMMSFANHSWGHTGTVENTHSMVIHRPDGMTWTILVSGNSPEESSELAGIFQDAIDAANIDAPAPTTSTTTTTTTTSTTTIAVPTSIVTATTLG